MTILASQHSESNLHERHGEMQFTPSKKTIFARLQNTITLLRVHIVNLALCRRHSAPPACTVRVADLWANTPDNDVPNPFAQFAY